MKNNFSISPRILSHLGEELIKNENIALLELVKNSYDACSKTCDVKFFLDKDEKLEKILIKDDGIGMDRDVIENAWLTIGTDYKKKRIKVNECGRVPLGEKGIGRLGVHKLGNKITVISKKENGKELKLKIDWKRLDIAKEIEDFKVDIQESKNSNIIDKSGTHIIIEDLKQEWTSTKIREIYRSLNTLNNPFSSEKEIFQVNVLANSKKIFEKLPTFKEIKNNAMYQCSCKMEGFNITEFKYSFIPWESLKKIDRGREINFLDVHYRELTNKDTKERINLDSLEIGPIEFELLIFEKDANILNYTNLEKASLNEYLKANSGIKIYRDNIRVNDYGENENDWLGLNLKRLNQVGGNISTNIVIGSVKLDRLKSSALIEKTNREGFIENTAYEGFTNAINYALSLFVKERNIDKLLLVNLYKEYKHIEPVLYELNNAIEIINNEIIDDLELKNKLLANLNRVNIEYKDVKDKLLKSANAGLNLSVAIHEIEKLISSLQSCITNDDKIRALELSIKLDKIVTGYSVMIKKSSMKIIYLSKIINTALDNYSFRFSDHRIDVKVNYKDKSLEGYFSETESTSIITNILDNSIYWLSFARKEDRQISIWVTDEISGYHSIIISDNGPGFNMPFDVATEVFVTGKPHSIGSGLGLHIAKEMMYSMGGKLKYFDKKDISFPKEIESNKITNAIIGLCFKIDKDKN